MIVSYSLPGITRAGSKGMISARNIKAPLVVSKCESITAESLLLLRFGYKDTNF
jgi:hypothetical protein